MQQPEISIHPLIGRLRNIGVRVSMYFRKTVTTSLKKAPEVATLGLSLCVPLGYKFFLSYCHYSICSSGMQYSQNENLMIYLWLFSTQGKMAYCGISATLFIPVMRSALDNFHAVSVYLKYYPVFLVNVNAPISCKVSA